MGYPALYLAQSEEILRQSTQQFEHPAAAPDQVWVADITYLKVSSIYRYLAVVMDRCSRRIIGWALGKQRNVTLTLRALNHAVAKRRPPPGLIFYTDRGIEYYANAFRKRLSKLKITQSMNRPGKVRTMRSWSRSSIR
jgi:putative transposase